jgi:hypothetical protein
MSDLVEQHLIDEVKDQIEDLMTQQDWGSTINRLQDEKALLAISWELMWDLGWAFLSLITLRWQKNAY